MLAMQMTTDGDGDNLAQLVIKVLKGTGMGTEGVRTLNLLPVVVMVVEKT